MYLMKAVDFMGYLTPKGNGPAFPASNPYEGAIKQVGLYQGILSLLRGHNWVDLTTHACRGTPAASFLKELMLQWGRGKGERALSIMNGPDIWHAWEAMEAPPIGDTTGEVVGKWMEDRESKSTKLG